MLKRASITQPCAKLLRLRLDEVKMNLASRYKEYREYKRNAAAARKTWLLALAESRATHESTQHVSPDLATDKHLRMILQAEGTRRLFRRIHSAVGKDRMKGVSMVIAKDKNGQWNEQHEPRDIFSSLIREYKAKYHQTESTPPMTYPL